MTAAVETVTIINKSGKIVSTGKHIVNLFKDARAAYHDKKKELKENKLPTVQHNQSRLEVRTIKSEHSQRSRRSNLSSRSNRSQRHRKRDNNNCSRPPLTARNLSYITESYASTRSSHNSGQRSYRSASPNQNYNEPSESIPQRQYPPMHRRHTTSIDDTNHTTVLSTHPPPYTSRITRSRSNPDLSKDSKIDMNLAYGKLPFDCLSENDRDLSSESELQTMVGRLDNLLLEARCLQHSATAIIAHLQKDPEAMAAVGLTLAELSTIVSKMSPSVLRTFQTASPAIFALLASPQFLIATGVAMGVTVIMFGGFHIIKSIQSTVDHKREAKKLESAMIYNDIDIESIKSWRRGVAESEAFSLYSSADEEYITPEAARHYRGLIQNRSLADYVKKGSVCSEQSCRTAKQKSSKSHSSSRKAPSEITSISRRATLKESSTKALSEITSISRRGNLKESSTKAPSEVSSGSRRTSLIASSTTSSQGSDKTKKKKNKGKKPSILSTLFEIKRS
ncbi:putative mfs general substrate transporter [Erysiphe neolycopersici]|uniref:Putative mfs general substrate transporter n=1 Tax=Erysiphe neolycopersici TaxID=212602 RepID=A0A420HJZ8_9PEZI|nr:putative mfs general substrate transporter [Erysiphe neolycopersici]